MHMLDIVDPRRMITVPELFTAPSVAIATIEAVDGKGNPITDERKVYLQCQFNPAELKITKKVKWKTPEKYPPARNAPDLDFGGGEPATFKLDLVFDTTQDTKRQGRDVRKHTNELLKLVKVHGSDMRKRKPPPRVKFQWGKITLFLAVVEQVVITFTLFDSDGTPLRAKAAVDFKQDDDSDDPLPPTNPTTRTEARRTRRVRQGDRLDLIAYEEYGHPSHWRHLAEANGLLDPLDLQPGQILVVPLLP
jgi:nucleoid-associated protein YgaU